MLLRSPWNIHDDQAVAVHTLSGTLIGWVPRADNSRFQQQELVFGRVEFVGAALGTEAWGVRVVAQPALMPAAVSPFPWTMLPAVKSAAVTTAATGKKTARGRLSSASAPVTPSAGSAVDAEVVASGIAALEAAIWPGSWKKLSVAASQISRGLCEVTGASPAVLGGRALELIPVWQYHDDRRVMKVNELINVDYLKPCHSKVSKHDGLITSQTLSSAWPLLIR